MKSTKILLIVSNVLLFSACSSKDNFYRGTYNWLQDDKFCKSKKECDYKRFHSYRSNQDKKMSYDEYRKGMKSDKN